MARIAGINLPNEKRIEIALTYIYGVGRSQAQHLLEQTKVDPNVKAKDISDADVAKLRGAIESLTVEGDLRREKTAQVKRLSDINSYRGIRHAKKLPARGQRTKTNARTKRGKRVTVGSGKIKAAAKT
jgi:small subunit ribosomal protein S13